MRAAPHIETKADLSFFNARIRGLRGRLLSREDYEHLLKAESAEQEAERLKSTAYGPEVEAASARLERKEEVIQAALRADLSEVFGLVWKVAPQEVKPLLKAVFSGWEAFDIKTLLRGISGGVKRDELLDTLIPAGELTSAALATLVTAKDVPDLIAFLSTWGSPYAKAMRPGLARYKRDRNTVDMEIAADIYSSQGLLAMLEAKEGGGIDSDIIRRWLSLKIDTINIATLLKVVGEGYSKEGASGFFIKGGRLNKTEFAELSTLKNREELVDALRKRGGDPGIAQALREADPRDVVMIEERLEEVLKRKLARAAAEDPLSIALSGAFVYMKVREVKNIRIITRGKAFRIPEAELRRFMIYPI